jgi:hypothetical protein
MSALDDLNSKVDALSAEVEIANGKADAVIAELVKVRDELAGLIGSTVTDADLEAIGAKIDATLASVKAQEAEDDSALAP